MPEEISHNLDERKFLADTTAKERELDLREREVRAREREIRSKDRELARSKWLNPLIIGIFVAAIGLISSVVVASLNNSATQKLERQRAQSSVILEAIKTGTGNTDASCKNLVFLSNLHLVDDPDNTIHKQCALVPPGIPSLPTGSNAPADRQTEAVQIADTIRNLRNPNSTLQFSAVVKGNCHKVQNYQYTCTEGDTLQIAVSNNTFKPLYAAVVNVDQVSSATVLTNNTIVVQPNSKKLFTPTFLVAAPFGVETIKVFAARQTFDVTLFFRSLVSSSGDSKPVGPVPHDNDWGVVDLVLKTHKR